MDGDQEEEIRMSILLEDAVLATFLADLREKGLSDELVKRIGLSFLAKQLPSAEVMAELIKVHSGDKIA